MTQDKDPSAPPGPLDAAIDALADAVRAAPAVIEGPNGVRYVVVPRGGSLERIPDPHALPPYIVAEATGCPLVFGGPVGRGGGGP